MTVEEELAEQRFLSGKEDRRHDQRRSGHDQRQMIRFELDKEDRRVSNDRRDDRSWHSNATI